MAPSSELNLIHYWLVSLNHTDVPAGSAWTWRTRPTLEAPSATIYRCGITTFPFPATARVPADDVTTCCAQSRRCASFNRARERQGEGVEQPQRLESLTPASCEKAKKQAVDRTVTQDDAGSSASGKRRNPLGESRFVQTVQGVTPPSSVC